MQRGEEYADSWALENQNARFVKKVLQEVFGISGTIAPEHIRLLVMAALIDVKDSRMDGPYKRDTVVDGIAYRAMFAQLMLEWETKCYNPSKSSKLLTEHTQTVSSDHPMATLHTTQRLQEIDPA